MLNILLASLFLISQSQAAPLLFSGGNYAVDKSIKDAGVAYNGIDSGWMELKLEAKNPSSGAVLNSNYIRASMKLLPEKAGTVDRYEWSFVELKDSGVQGHHDFGKELTGKKFIAYDAGLVGEGLSVLKKEDKLQNALSAGSAKVGDADRNSLVLQTDEKTISSYIFYISHHRNCMSMLAGKAVGAKWKKQTGEKSTEECEFSGWAMVSGKKIAVVNFSEKGEFKMDNGVKGPEVTASFQRKGTYFFNPADQEFLREMKGTFSMPGFQGQTYTSAHVYPALLASKNAPAAPQAAPAPAKPTN